MNISRKEFAAYVKNYDFRGLFNYLGWNYSNNRIPPIEVKGKSYSFEVVADKSAFKIVVCTAADDALPPYAVRCQIAGIIKKDFHENILIFQSKKTGLQAWFYSYTVGGKAKKTEIVYEIGQDPERLYERAAGLIFDLDEEDNITILDVTNRVNANFAVNAEKVTKKFYDGFKREHNNLLKFIKGIDSALDKEWYASIMLNRLMFCYFMQKRGFLNHDTHYLRHKLDESKAKLGANQFYSFYRDFLLTLFHKGFGSYSHSEEVREMIGDIPYLNGGLFEVHEIEQKCPDIMIDDNAFESIFNLFDLYEWHLDSRECASGNEISPDVLGYIFEKYINDRAQMGAYYTQEDITEYISRNSIIPFIFTKAEEKYSEIFAPDGEIRKLIKNSGDKYIFDTVKKGIDLPLPDYIEVGIDTTAPDLLTRRARWNEPAAPEYALPTEIWREVVERRKRYQDTVAKIKDGTIATIQDFITYNLDICAFAQDVIDTVDDPQFIRVVYTIIKNMTILDPTCGSGAFLFAALNILEPLYNSCLSRMEDYLKSGISLNKFVRRMFEDELDNIDKNHPNKLYYIYKTIILNNLYGVDIMKEATETAKLRLFLKLVSTANPNYGKANIGIEPLPDIDFNIKCGNSLVGYATHQEVNRALQGNILSMLMTGQVLESMRQLSVATHRYKEKQLGEGDDYAEIKEAKAELKKRQQAVNEILDRTLYEERREGMDYAAWLEKTQPFHWISEFYDIVSNEDGNGGFDVVIGNPPYVEYNEKSFKYLINGYDTQKCANLYAYMIERSYHIGSNKCLCGMIVPISAFSNASMNDLQCFMKNEFGTLWISTFHQRPAALFTGVLQRLSIFIGNKNTSRKEYYTTHVMRWYSNNRHLLFDSIRYIKSKQDYTKHFLKLGWHVEATIADKFYKQNQILNYVLKNTQNNKIYYRTAGGGYWVTILNSEFATSSLSNKSMAFKEDVSSKAISATLNSNLFWWYYCVNYDHFNFKDYMIFGFRMNYHKAQNVDSLIRLSDEMEETLLKNARHYIIKSKTRGCNETITYNKSQTKNIMDKIDMALAQTYDLTQEELDFILNYDIKYRMGIDDSDEDA